MICINVYVSVIAAITVACSVTIDPTVCIVQYYSNITIGSYVYSNVTIVHYSNSTVLYYSTNAVQYYRIFTEVYYSENPILLYSVLYCSIAQ